MFRAAFAAAALVSAAAGEARAADAELHVVLPMSGGGSFVGKGQQDSLDALGIARDDAERVREGIEKFSVPALAAFDPRPATLRAMYLQRDMRPGIDEPMRRYSGLDAVEHLLPNVYRPRLWRAMGREAATAQAAVVGA